MVDLTHLEAAVLVLYAVGAVLLVVGRVTGLLTLGGGVLWLVIVAFVPGLGALALGVFLLVSRRRRPGRLS